MVAELSIAGLCSVELVTTPSAPSGKGDIDQELAIMTGLSETDEVTCAPGDASWVV